MSAGMYLPLTAVLGGSLFVRPEGYQEAARDVVRLSPHIAELQEQVMLQAGLARRCRDSCGRVPLVQ